MNSPSSKRFCLLAFSIALSGCGTPPPPAPPGMPSDQTQPSMYRSLARGGAVVDVEAARDMISLYRRNHGLPGLMLDEKLQSVAEAQAQEMARRGAIEAGDGGKLQARLDAAGAKTHAAVENLSAGYHTLAEAFSGWRQSAPHNARMLDARARRMGLATAYAPGAKYKVFWALILTD